MFLCRTHLCAIEGYSNIAYQITQELFLSDSRPFALSLACLETICAYDVVIINGGFNDVAFDLFKTKIESFLSREEKESKAL